MCTDLESNVHFDVYDWHMHAYRYAFSVLNYSCAPSIGPTARSTVDECTETKSISYTKIFLLGSISRRGLGVGLVINAR